MLALRALPVVQQPGSGPGNAYITTLAPDRHPPAHLVDEPVLFNPVSRPFSLERELLGILLLGLGYWHEVGADPSLFDDLVGNTLIGETEMAFRLFEG